MLKADDRSAEELEQKTSSLVRHTDLQEFQPWKHHKVWCFLCYARDTRHLFRYPGRWPRFVCAMRTLQVVALT